MGLVFHQALVVTAFKPAIDYLHRKAYFSLRKRELDHLLSEKCGGLNGHYTFAILPSGSSAEWEEDIEHRNAMREVIDHIDYKYNDINGLTANYVLVTYGGDTDGMGTILNQSLPYGRVDCSSQRVAPDAQKLAEENRKLREIVFDTLWMARRYADKRSTYAPSIVNKAIDAAIELGIPPAPDIDIETGYCRDGMFGDWNPKTGGWKHNAVKQKPST